MSGYKVVASDMDGTLLNEDHTITEYTMSTLHRLARSYGVHFVFATGRHHKAVGPAPVALTEYFNTAREKERMAAAAAHAGSEQSHPGFFLISSNGARIHDPAGRLLVAHNIDPAIVRELYDRYGRPYTPKRCDTALDPGPPEYTSIQPSPPRSVPTTTASSSSARDSKVAATSTSSSAADEPAEADVVRVEEQPVNDPNTVHVSAYTTDEWVISTVNVELQAIKDRFGMMPTVVPFDPDCADASAGKSVLDSFPVLGVGKICFRCENRALLNDFEEDIKRRFGERVGVAFSSDFCLDVIPGGVSKATGLREVVRYLSEAATATAAPAITLRDVIAFGDSMNDMEMLQAVGKGCVMGNAQARLKAALPQCEVVGSNDQDGVARKLREVYGLDVQATEV